MGEIWVGRIRGLKWGKKGVKGAWASGGDGLSGKRAICRGSPRPRAKYLKVAKKGQKQILGSRSWRVNAHFRHLPRFCQGFSWQNYLALHKGLRGENGA